MIQSILSKCFFGGYVTPTPTDVIKEGLKESGLQFEEIRYQNASGSLLEALQLKSCANNRTGNVLIFADTTSYQDRLQGGVLPRKYRHYLDSGVDVVVWNPTKLEGRTFSQELLSLLRKLKENQPSIKIAIKGHCAAVEPALAAATDLQDSSITLILDRGFASAEKIARSFSILAALEVVRRVIREFFSCDGEQKLRVFQGRIVFVVPQELSSDQIVFWKGVNQTQDMYRVRMENGHQRDKLVVLSSLHSDHWSPWDQKAYREIDTVLIEEGFFPEVIQEESVDPQPTPNSLRCVWFAAKAWC